jgi:phage baseplate assembly protein V
MNFVGHIKGLVAEIGECGRVKVRLPEYDDLITDWLPVVQAATLGARTWAVPRLDTQVVVLPGTGLEDAVVLGGIYSQPDPPPFEDAAVIGVTADDDVSISYDPGTSLLTITAPQLIKIVATNIEIEAEVKVDGGVTHTGKLTHSGESESDGPITLSGDLTQTGAYALTGDITQTGNLEQTGQTKITLDAIIGPLSIPFTTHKHPTAAPGEPSPPIS